MCTSIMTVGVLVVDLKKKNALGKSKLVPLALLTLGMRRRGRSAPVSVHRPGGELTRLRAILGTLASSAFGELARVGFPFPACEVRALSDAFLVLPDEVSHDDTGPVRELARVPKLSESLYQLEQLDLASMVLQRVVFWGFKVVLVVA